MSIGKDGYVQMVCCDKCSNTGDEFDDSEFQMMINSAKRQGWKIELVAGEWQHTCPNCVETPLQRAQRMFGR